MFLNEFALDQIEVLDSYSNNLSDKVLDFIGSYDPDRLLYSFRVNAGLKDNLKVFGPYPNWENSKIGGHTMGHYLVACAQGIKHGYADRKGKDGRTLSERLTYIIEELDKCQKNYPLANGFIFGATYGEGEGPEWQFDQLDSGNPKGTWVPWYTMHKILAGLLEVFKLTDNHLALEIAENLGEWVYKRVTKWTEEIQSKVLAVEYGGMNDCLYELYKCAKNDGYKDFNHFAIAAHQFDEEKLFGLIASGAKNALNMRHANTTIPKFIGALNRYRALGDNKYLNYAQSFWNLVANHHTYITGGNSESEHFGNDDVLEELRSNANCETCNTHNMLKLTRELYKIMGDKKYADYYDQTYTNAILASCNSNTGMTTYFQPMASGCFKPYCNPDLEKNYFWCCTGTGLENFTKLGDSFYFYKNNQLYVNMYSSSRLNWDEKGLVLSQKENLEKNGEVIFTVEKAPQTEVEILFRKPDWAQEVSYELKDKNNLSTTYMDDYLSLQKVWKAGDQIRLNFILKMQVYSLPDSSEVFAFKYGPYVLAANLGSDEKMITYHIGVQTDVCANKIVLGQEKELNGSYLNTRGIGILESEKIKLDGSPAELKENPLKFLKKVSDFTFELETERGGEKLTFVPYYKLHEQRYGIYWHFIF